MSTGCHEAKVKDCSAKSEYLTDDPGLLLSRILEYGDVIESAAKTSPRRGRASESDEGKAMRVADYLRKPLGPICKTALPKLEKLRSLAAERGNTKVDARSARYFWDIFAPYQQLLERPSVAGMTVDRSQTPLRIGAIESDLPLVCNAIQDLIALKRFLSPSADWKEQRIFAKEREHVENLAKDQAFRLAVGQILEEFAISSIPDFSLSESKLLDDSTPEMDAGAEPAEVADRARSKKVANWIEALKAPTDPESPKTTIQIQTRRLCREFGLRAVVAGVFYPLEFRIFVQRNQLVIAVPSFLRLDWKRDFPGEVAELVQRRCGDYWTIRHQSTALPRSIEIEHKIWVLFGFCAALASRPLGSRKRATVAAVFNLFEDLLPTIYRYSSTQRRFSRTRSAKRLLAGIARKYTSSDLRETLANTANSRQVLALITQEYEQRLMTGKLAGKSALAALAEADQTFLAKQKGSFWSALKKTMAS